MAGDGIELYVGLTEAHGTDAALEACRTSLSSEEHDRAGRFVQARHQRLYILAHGLLRFALSNRLPTVAPADWTFVTDRHGRPFVGGPVLAKPVHFSLSHTEGCVACVISAREAVGVDVECMDRRGSLWDTAQHVFAATEIAALRGLPTGEFLDRFFDYWTLKEAYIKARGLGLRLPLDQFAMVLSDDTIAISFTGDIDDDPKRWHFTRFSPSARHRLAIADGSGTAGGLPVVTRSWPVPGG
ncbi:MAG TPA: 4'-phosphopantetheinyl transferase superfamily protein [Bradyrhizobium sp.]|jgi:4'-phosphopantetheinyl transferase|nr:4'-phosphopantetheinyl transferase superfamily protein [Bradyrhizobium sp.]